MENQLVSATEEDRSSWFLFTTNVRALKGRPGELLRATVSYDNQCRNRHPHFSITADLFSRHPYPNEQKIVHAGHVYWECGGGCMHEDIAATFPELAPLVRWHLCDVEGSMHYIANSSYWHKLWGDSIAGPPWDEDEYVKRYGTEKLRECFANTSLHGEIEDDPELDSMVSWSPERLKDWLQERQPALKMKFLAALEVARGLKGTI